MWTLFSIRQLGMASVFLVLGRNAWREVPLVVRSRTTLGLMLVTEFFSGAHRFDLYPAGHRGRACVRGVHSSWH